MKILWLFIYLLENLDMILLGFSIIKQKANVHYIKPSKTQIVLLFYCYYLLFRVAVEFVVYMNLIFRKRQKYSH